MSDFEALMQEFVAYHNTEENDAAIKRGHEVWETIGRDTKSTELGMCFRFVMLAHFRKKDYAAGDVWWRRSMDQFAAVSNPLGIGMLLITPAFRSLARGHTDIALMILKGMAAVVGCCSEQEEGNIINRAQILRQAHEKAAFVYYKSFAFRQAEELYRVALEYAVRESETTGSRRGEMKVRGGRALACLFDDPAGAPDPALFLGDSTFDEVYETAARGVAHVAPSRVNEAKRLLLEILEDSTDEDLRTVRQRSEHNLNLLDSTDPTNLTPNSFRTYEVE